MAKSDPQFERQLAAIFQAEAAEHVQRMQGCVAELQGGGPAPPAARTVELLFRATHSLKGAARAVGEDEVEAVCHAAEGVLAALQRGRLAWSADTVDTLRDVVQALQQALAGGGAPGALVALVPRLERLEQDAPGSMAAFAASPTLPAPSDPPAGPEAEETLRIPVARLGSLLYQVEELAGQLHTSGPGAERAQRHLASAVETLLGDLKAMLLQPVGALRPFLLATVRELARSQHKDVELRIRGDDLEMDRRLLEQLREPLVHLLRNAIHHGIEPAAQRAAAGKPARAVLELAIAARSGGRVAIVVGDDGVGIDPQQLAEAARAAGAEVPPDADAAGLLRLVFGAGISTAARLTPVAGRGVGLAIVRETIEAMGGSIAVASTPGHGTTFTIELTSSLATYRAIEVLAGGRRLLLPTSRVERVLRIPAAELRRDGKPQVVAFDGEDLPLASLADVLGLPAAAGPRGHLHCVVVTTGERRLAFGVDAIRGEQQVLRKPVDAGLTRSPVVKGAAVLASGQFAPLLNVPELVRIALREEGRARPAEVAPGARPRERSVLLAEDSSTSRTLLKNILELAGHHVEIAVDGVEALQKLRSGRYDVLVSDVEMPRLDGIALTRAIRADAALAQLPVVLVTSLGSPGDRERGTEAGADAWIVKSDFEQDTLLDAIAELA